MIERKKYIELCQVNAISSGEVVIYYKGNKYYPNSFWMWFDDKGRVHNSAVLRCITSNSELRVDLSEVCENEND